MKIGQRGQRGLRCSCCGELRYFWSNEITSMNVAAFRRVQCQNCGHTHWEECPRSKRVKELKACDRMRETMPSSMLLGPKIKGLRHKQRAL